MCSVVSDSLQPHGLQPTRLLCPWNFPGKNTAVDCHFFLQEFFPTQRSIPSPALTGRFFATEPPGKEISTLKSIERQTDRQKRDFLQVPGIIKIYFLQILYCLPQLYKSIAGLPRWLSGKESACSAGDLGSIPGLG